jgi:Tfp pilus assembly protein PilO
MRSRVVIVGVLVGVVVLLLWNLLIFAPKGRDLSAAKKEAQAAQQVEVQLRQTLTALQEISKNGPEIAAKLDRLSAAVPTAPDLDGFILSANQIAVQSGIDWLSVSPSVAQPGTSGPSVIPLTMSIQGGFFQVLDYLNRLEDLGRLVIVDSINATAAGAQGTSTGGTGSATGSTTGAPTLSVTLTGRMFTMAAPPAPAGSTPSGTTNGANNSTPPASGNSSGNTTSTTAQVN